MPTPTPTPTLDTNTNADTDTDTNTDANTDTGNAANTDNTSSNVYRQTFDEERYRSNQTSRFNVIIRLGWNVECMARQE